MLALTAHNNAETAIEKPIKVPFYLVYLDFDVPLYLCTFKTVSLKNFLWSASRRIKVSGLKTDAAGKQSGMIELSNLDNLISALVLTEGCAGKAAVIYMGYGNPTDADIVTRFIGIMDDFETLDGSVKIRMLSKNASRISPGIVIARPDFNHLPAPGTVIKSGTTTITLNTGSR